MLIGEYHYSADSKGRLAIPAPYRPVLGNAAIITRGLDGCLALYPKKAWESWAAKLVNLPVSSSQARNLVRFQLGSARAVELDSQGRILLPAPLRHFANITGKVVVSGVGDRIEIWGEDKWERLTQVMADSSAGLVEGIGI